MGKPEFPGRLSDVYERDSQGWRARDADFYSGCKGRAAFSLLSEFVPGSQWSGGDRSFACAGIPGSG